MSKTYRSAGSVERRRDPYKRERVHWEENEI